MVTYFKSRLDLSKALIVIIDNYWCGDVGEIEFVQQLREIVSKNKEMVYKADLFTGTITQRLGKKRISLLRRVLSETEETWNNR